MPDEFIPSIECPEPPSSDAWWFIYSGYRLLVKISESTAVNPTTKEVETLGIDINHRIYLGTFRGRSCYAADGNLQDESLSGFSFHEIRTLFDRLEDGFYEIALTAVHLVEWDKTCRFCSSCRGSMKSRGDIRAKECEACGRLDFPRISPAIIVLVEKEDSLLLARSPRFPGAFYSVLAGFVNPGESLEEAVHREVKEETGITIKDIAYFGSQPWPFPDSLMIGFTAKYESGDMRIDGEEIIEAAWYTPDNLPQIPGKLSIARQLIDSFVARHSLR